MDNFLEWMREHTTLVLLLIGGLAVGVIFLKKSPQGATTAAAPQADLSGLATDSSGNHLVYRDVADTFINISKVQGSYNTNPAMPVPSAPPPPPTNPAAPVEHPIEAFIRAQNNSPLTSAYDAAHPQGIPIRSTPGGAITGYAPYGSEIDLTSSTATKGASNFADKTGSTAWLQTSQGFISAYDLTGYLN
jgi:hypothetical protein